MHAGHLRVALMLVSCYCNASSAFGCFCCCCFSVVLGWNELEILILKKLLKNSGDNNLVTDYN